MIRNRARSRLLDRRRLTCELLEARQLLASNVVINEIYYDPPDKSVAAEFIELHNAGDTAADLSGWRFSNGVDFQFDPGTTLAADEYLVVAQDLTGYESAFAGAGSPVAYQVPAGTAGGQNFGGSLGMDFVVNTEVRVIEIGAFDSRGDGLNRTITVQLWSRDDAGTPANPNDDTGAGVLAAAVFTAGDPGTLVGGSRFKPLDSPLVLSPGAYTIVAYGYGTGELLFNGAAGGAGTTDSGNGLLSFVGGSRWINAVDAYPVNVDSHPYQYGAGTFRFEPTAAPPIFVPAVGPWLGKLSNQGEQVTLRNELDDVVDQVDYRVGFPWPIAANGEGASMELIQPGLDNDLGSSWRSSVAPTPGLQNSVYDVNPAPNLRQVSHQPAQPTSGQDVTVAVKVTDPDGMAGVTLEYQVVDPGDYISLADPRYQTGWSSVGMTDTGGSTFAATLPGQLQSHRRLVRYRITATDSLGSSVTAPFADDPQPNFAFFAYDGVPAWTGADEPGVTDPVTYDTDVMTSLPAYHLISRESDVRASQYDRANNDKVFRFAGTLVVGEEVYDHVHYRIRGSGSTYVTGKNKWKFRFNRGHYYQGYDQYGSPWPEELRTLNFGTAASPWAPANRGLAGMDEALAFRLFNTVGVAAPYLSPFQFRVIDAVDEAPDTGVDPVNQYAGDLWGLYLAFENPSGSFLDSHGLPDGNLYRYDWSPELENQGAGLPGGVALANNFVAAYNQTNPIQPVSWWRDNVDLEGYYSLRAITETLNHTDLTEHHNMLLFYDPETEKWSQLPWDLDLLYEEFDRWGPDGVQSQLPYEQFRKALEHSELNIEFQARVRELQDLLLNPDQVWQMVEEYARYVEPMAAVDRAIWDHHPDTTAAHTGAFYQEVAVYPAGNGAAGEVRRAINPVGFEGMINWVKNFIVPDPGPDGFGGDQLAALHADPAIPDTPTINYTGGAGYPIDGLIFQTGPFSDPQGAQTFGAIEWRIGEITDPASPGYDPAAPVVYEIDAVWESGEVTAFGDTASIPADALKIGRSYRARVRMQDDTGRWSHWSQPVQFVPGSPGGILPANAANLAIVELNYNPHDARPGEVDADNDDFEYIELINFGTQTIELGGVELVEVNVAGDEQGVGFSFALQTLGPGERIVVVRDVTAFQSRYGDQIQIAAGNDSVGGREGEYGGGLSNGGERLTLRDAIGGTIAEFTYGDSGPWPGRADGGGSSLELLDPALDANDPNNWRSSSEYGGSPGRAGLGPLNSVVIHEVLTHTDPPVTASDSIELFNPTPAEINVGGWFLSDSGSTADGSDGYQKFRIPPGTVVPAESYLVFNEEDFNPAGTPSVNNFALNGAHGDDVWLVQADTQGRLTYFIDHVEFGAAANGESFGRWPNAAGDLYPLISNTLGDANSGPRVGPVIISEIMYHPKPPTPEALVVFPDLTEDDLEFIEIYNPTSEDIDLTDWRIRGGIDYEFPAGATLPAGEEIAILSFDPEQEDGPGNPVNQDRVNAVRHHYGIHSSIELWGGFTGQLANGGERVQLQRPDEPPAEEPAFVPHLLEDEVSYDDSSPWPAGVDGSGLSLTRYAPAEWGHSPISWAGADPTPGWMVPITNLLEVMAFVPMDSGFEVRFNRPYDPAGINLYDVEAGTFGPPDVTLVSESTGPVAGSLVMDGQRLSFVATGGPLPTDAYTATLRSAPDGLRDALGRPLDGNLNGTPGGDFVLAFNTDPRSIGVRLPDFSRGPGQSVRVPAGAAGLPMFFSDERLDAGNVESVELIVDYDPALLRITGADPGPDAPPDAEISADTTTPGMVVLTISSPSALPTGSNSHLVTLIADVPAEAPYGRAHRIVLMNMVVTSTTGQQIPATVDEVVHVTAYSGDTTGNRAYSGLDAQRAARVAVGLDGGFAAYAAIDPFVIADVTGDASLSGLDAQCIALQVVGLNPSEIPPLPQPLRLELGPVALAARDRRAEAQPVPVVPDLIALPGGPTDGRGDLLVVAFHKPSHTAVVGHDDPRRTVGRLPLDSRQLAIPNDAAESDESTGDLDTIVIDRVFASLGQELCDLCRSGIPA